MHFLFITNALRLFQYHLRKHHLSRSRMFQNIISNVFTHKITDTVPNHKTFYEEQKLPKHYFLQFKISKMSPECEMGIKAMR